MYQFRDVLEVGTGRSLPSEAVMINGEYIEDENSSIYIKGYRTLYTKGRENLKKTITAEEIGSMDGTKVTSTKYPEREIIVGFQLIAEDSETFRTAFNDLNKILDGEEAQFIFHDEEEVYFTGTPYMELDAETGRNAITGEWTIYCADPFKYSVEEFTADSFVDTDGKTTMLIDYGGTVPAHPKFRVDFYSQTPEVDETNAGLTDYAGNENEAIGNAGDCGYVAFFDNQEHILQFGNPDYSVVQPEESPEQVIAQSFEMAGNYSSAIQQLWKPNQSGTSYGSYNINGAFAETYGAYSTPSATTSGKLIGWKWSGGKWVESRVSDSSSSAPAVSYCVSYRAYERTASTVRLELTIKAQVGTVSSSVKANWKKAKLEAVFTIKDKSYSKVIKAAKKVWKKGAHVTTFNFKVSDLGSSTIDLGCAMKVNESGASGSAGKLTSRSTNTITIPVYVDKDPSNYFLKPSSYGTVTNNAWHGATIARNIGTAGAGAFSVNGTLRFTIGSGANDVLQLGLLDIMALDASNKVIAGVRMQKVSKGKEGNILYIADGNTKITKKNYSMAYKAGAKISINIQKIGKTVTWKVGSDSQRTYSSGNTNTATRLIIACYQYGAQPPMDWIGVSQISCTKYPDGSAVDNIAPFVAGDILVADGRTATIMLTNSSNADGGTSRPDLGALGNDWETLVLKEGQNQIHSAYSDWAGETLYRKCKSDDVYGRDYFLQLDDSVPYDENMEYYDSSHTQVYPTEAEYNASPTSYYQFMDAGTDAVTYYNSSGTVLATQPTYAQFTENPANYYVKETTEPKFSISYREVFI